MKFCLRVSNSNFKLCEERLYEADELLVEYKTIDLRNLKKIHDTFDKSKRIVVNVEGLQELKYGLIETELKYEDYVTMLKSMRVDREIGVVCNHPSISDDLKFCDIIFPSIISDWDELVGAVEFGYKELYIGDALGFDMENVSAYCKEHLVRVRMFPDVAQSTSKYYKSIKKFFIRPEDIDLYANVVDAFEFWAVDSRQCVMLDIYKGRKWSGLLSDIIKEYVDEPEKEIFNFDILDSFGKIRYGCKHRCNFGRCNFCDIAIVEHTEEKEEEANEQEESVKGE